MTDEEKKAEEARKAAEAAALAAKEAEAVEEEAAEEEEEEETPAPAPKPKARKRRDPPAFDIGKAFADFTKEIDSKLKSATGVRGISWWWIALPVGLLFVAAFASPVIDWAKSRRQAAPRGKLAAVPDAPPDTTSPTGEVPYA